MSGTTSTSMELSLYELERNLGYRVRVAATGVVLVAALFADTQPAWVQATGNYPYNWDLWQLIGTAGGGWAGPTAAVMIVTLLLALFAATEARVGWAVAAAVAAAALFGQILVLGSTATYDGNGYTTTGAWNGAWFLTALLFAWAVVVTLTAWKKRRDEDRWLASR
jgi:hypothetical protein